MDIPTTSSLESHRKALEPASPAPLKTGSLAPRLLGVWALREYLEEQEGGTVSHPFGTAPEGFLIYTAEGFVSAQLMRPGRSEFQSNSWQQGTPTEYQEAGSGYIAYCGVYAVDEMRGTITHTPFTALVPNLIGEQMARFLTLDGDELTLKTMVSPNAGGGYASSVLKWRRVRSTDRHDCSIL